MGKVHGAIAHIKYRNFLPLSVTGLFSGVIKVFNAHAGSVIATLDPDSIEDKDDIVGNDNGGGFGRGYPLSRLRCKPYSDAAAGNTLVAATYASGHLRVWNYANSTCVGQVISFRFRIPFSISV